MIITYPCYDDDPMYEDDQCTVNKILYDPRIKPVSALIKCVNYYFYIYIHIHTRKCTSYLSGMKFGSTCLKPCA